MKEKSIDKQNTKSLVILNIKEKIAKFLKNFEKYSGKVVLILIGIIVIWIGISAVSSTAFFPATYNNPMERTFYREDNILLNIALVFVFLFIIYILRKILEKIKIKYVVPIIFSILFLTISISLCVYLKMGPIADQGQMMSCAQAIYVRAISVVADPGGYLNAFPYQFGFSLYGAIILWIIRKLTFINNFFKLEEFIYFQILNAFYSLINIVFLYLIAKKIFKNNEKVLNILKILLFFFSPYFVLFNTHIYGNIPGLMFSLIALYFVICYLENKKIYNIIIAGISISGAIIFKTNYNIFLIAIFIILFMDFIKSIQFRKFLMILTILFIYIFSQFGINEVFKRLYDKPVPDGIPMLSYVYMGMAPLFELNSGWYTPDLLNIFLRNELNSEKAEKESKELIQKRLEHFKENPKELNDYFWDKVRSTWLNPTYQTIWLITAGTRLDNEEYRNYFEQKTKIIEMTDYQSELYKKEEQYFDTLQITIFIFAGLALLLLSKNNETEYLLLPVIFLGGLLFHIFWETKSIYVIQYYYLLVPFTAYGINEFLEILKKLFNKIKEKIKSINVKNL